MTYVGCVDQTVVACSAAMSSLNQAPEGQKILRLCRSSLKVSGDLPTRILCTNF